MGDFDLPDDVAAGQADAAHGEPGRVRVRMRCRHRIGECRDMGPCGPEPMGEPECYGSRREATGHMGTARADMQTDTRTRWERL